MNSPFGRDFFRVGKSTNGLTSFGNPEVTADSLFSNFSSGAPGFNRGIGITFPSIAVDRSTGPNRGRVYLTWNEALNFYNDPLPTWDRIPRGARSSPTDASDPAGRKSARIPARRDPARIDLHHGQPR
jgi:hypothetical protein